MNSKNSGFGYFFAVSGNSAAFNAILIVFFVTSNLLVKKRVYLGCLNQLLLVPSLQQINQTDTNEKEIK